MMSDLVTRLRELADMPCLAHGKPDTTFEEAADEIERLRAEVNRLQALAWRYSIEKESV